MSILVVRSALGWDQRQIIMENSNIINNNKDNKKYHLQVHFYFPSHLTAPDQVQRIVP